jgi:MFS family permease
MSKTTTASTWAPLTLGVFRALWLATLVSNIGTWMQTVGAQWLLVDEPNAATLVALVQTANSLPVLLLALPAGVLADFFDRRRLLLAVQLFLVSAGGLLTVLTLGGQMPPALLLAFTFTLGAGTAMQAPVYQALIPDIVPRAQLPSASALASISINIARAVGPALAGLVISAAGVGAVFAVNAATYALYVVVLLAWRSPTPSTQEPVERFVPALRAGARYVRHAPVVRRIILRLALFLLPANVLWSLLAVIANQRLGLGSSGYGLLLAALGIGAVAGAFVLPSVSARLSPSRMLLVASLVFAVALVVVGTTVDTILAIIVLVPAGAAWIAVLASLNAAVQAFLPGWVRARALSTYQLVQFGTIALSAAGWGAIADAIGLAPAFLVAAALLAAAGASVLLLPLIDVEGLDRSSVSYLPEPHLAVTPAADAGPVLVQVTYTVPPERADQFVQAMQAVGRSRRRTGATSWRLYQHGEVSDTYVETFLVPSWSEHLRQHGGRLTGADRAFDEAARSLSDSSPTVAHLLPTSVSQAPEHPT